MIPDFGKRIAQLTSSFGPGVVMLDRMSGTESVGAPFEYHLELIAPVDRLDYTNALGQKMCVQLETEAAPRFFNGHVTSFRYSGFDGRNARYSATIRPWLWLLTKSVNNRIFQKMTIPDVIKKVFRDRGFSDFEERLSGSYGSWEYLAQYRESDFRFVSRLMEQEGIYYFFEHTADKHTLVLSDSYSAHHAVPGYASVMYFPPDGQGRREQEHINGWDAVHQISAGAYASSDFNFEKPKQELLRAKQVNKNPHSHADFEVYEYPGEYEEPAEGEAYVKTRLEELQTDHLVASGDSNVRGMLAGHLFTLVKYPREDQNKEYLVVSTHIQVENNLPENTGGSDGAPFTCSFQGIAAKHQYRSPSSTPKPLISGPQTAVVVGKAGEDIWTDQYGRVKVQFHWDREGKKNENSSCWIRVAQVWAGNGWGAMHIPRIGQEVIVEFLEGDPDRPIITGRVYNAHNMPPYALPANQTQSGLKSRSTKDGGRDNFNELRFEDKKGHEEVHMQAERDMSTLVKNDQTLTVKHNRTVGVDGNQSHSVGGTRSLNVTKKNTQTLSDEHEVTVTKKVTETFNAEHVQTIKGPQTVNVKTDRTETITGIYDLTTDKKFNLTQGGTKLTFEGNKVSLDAASVVTIKRGPATITVDDAGNVGISTSTGILFECGPNKMSLSPSGIEINGTQISLQAGPSQVTLTPAAAELKGPTTKIEAQTICSITGTAMIKLNAG